MKLIDKMINRSNSFRWARSGLEIAKYRPDKYNGEGVYTDTEEWTDYFDVGDSISLNEYLEIENRYINTAIQILKLMDCSLVTLVCYENIASSLVRRTRSHPFFVKLNGGRNFYLSDEDIHLVYLSKTLKEKSRVPCEKMADVMKILLRGYANAFVCNESRKVYFELPGSYYLWLNCPVQYHTSVAEIVKNNNLFFNPRDKSSQNI